MGRVSTMKLREVAERVARRYTAGKHEGKLAVIHRWVVEYARLLGVTELPKVQIRDNLGSKWLGRMTWQRGKPNVMEIQASVLGDDATLERIVAHEMCHHVEFLGFTEAEIKAIKHGIRPASHGSRWQELAAKVNAARGAGFVTKTSDQSYAVSTEAKPYFMLIAHYDGSTLGYAIAVRISPRQRSFMDRRLAEGAKLIQTTDATWAKGAAKIGAGWSIPREPEARAKLEMLFAGA
jgi:hypothetical protein